MRFKLDENLPMDAADPIREAGHEVLHVLEQKLGGKPDSVISSVCLTENRILITLDAGFADITTHPPSGTPGVILLRTRRQDKATVGNLVRRFMATLGDRSIAGSIWIVTEKGVRVRT